MLAVVLTGHSSGYSAGTQRVTTPCGLPPSQAFTKANPTFHAEKAKMQAVAAKKVDAARQQLFLKQLLTHSERSVLLMRCPVNSP